MSDLIVAAMSEREARKLTERIRLTAHNYAEAKAKLMQLVQEAKDGNAHLALGYASWPAYLAEVLGTEPLRLARDDRQDMVRVLASEGMSTRAIAPIVGVDNKTVHNDLKRAVENSTPAPHAEPAAAEASLNAVTGLDGKRYANKPRTQLDTLRAEQAQAEQELNEAMTTPTHERCRHRHPIDPETGRCEHRHLPRPGISKTTPQSTAKPDHDRAMAEAETLNALIAVLKNVTTFSPKAKQHLRRILEETINILDKENN